MNCATCGYRLTMLFTSSVCDRCDGLLDLEKEEKTSPRLKMSVHWGHMGWIIRKDADVARLQGRYHLTRFVVLGNPEWMDNGNGVMIAKAHYMPGEDGARRHIELHPEDGWVSWVEGT